jgi:hypothetical protein
MKYSIDTSAIFDGWLRHYPPDVFPALWEKLDSLAANGDLRATEEVLHEIEKQHDEVFAWVAQRSELFIPIDGPIQVCVAEILAAHPRLVDNRRNRSGADPFVIALARVNGATVVTGEIPTSSLTKPHIPDVCAAMGIPWINLLQLIRREGWTFTP